MNSSQGQKKLRGQKLKRSELVRHEKDLMVHYIVAHDRGDSKTKADVMNEMKKNIEQRKFATKKR